MRNPWIAVDAATDPRVLARELSRAHELALGRDEPTSGVRELVLASWRRSLAAGVVPDADGSAVRLAHDELERRRAVSPLAPAVHAIFETLANLDGDARHVVAIADAEASLLWVTGDPCAVERARAMGFQEGASWAESDAGTNAVGTTVALDHAIQIFSAEHLVAAVHPWTCSAAPIHDPVSGELIGVVDLTADLRSAHPHTLSLAAMAAHAAETRLRNDAVARSRRAAEPHSAARMLKRPRAPSPRPATPRPSLSLRLLGHGATATLRSGASEHALRSIELLAVLAMHPEGMTAEQLALAMFGEDGKTVTVRAQVHRVRARLAEGVLDTQPYRLRARVQSDAAEVHRLLAAGRPAAALRAYRGSLLPTSEAPAIVAARELLEESVRRSVLTTADPALLRAWLAHPAGREDLAAARTLVAVLPSGDPRRAAATALVSAITRRLRCVA